MIGMILKNMRMSAGYSQKELASKLSVADTTISSYERENSQPDFDTILKIAEICGYEFKIVNAKTKQQFKVKDMAKEKDY